MDHVHATYAHHSFGNLVCKGDEISWSQLSQRTVRIQGGGAPSFLSLQKRTVRGWSPWCGRWTPECLSTVQSLSAHGWQVSIGGIPLRRREEIIN